MAQLTDKILLILTIAITIAGFVMALCVSLVLPREFINEEVYVRSVGTDPLSSDDNDQNLELLRSGQNSHVPKWYWTRNSKRHYGSINNYTWLVSISLPLSVDAPKSLRFACAGVALSEGFVLTGADCLSPPTPFNESVFLQASVRSGSDYFSKEGTEHRVKKFISPSNVPELYKSLFLLEIDPLILEHIDFPKLYHASFENKILQKLKFIAAGWGENLKPKDVTNFEKFHLEHWWANIKVDPDKLCTLASPNETTYRTKCYKRAVLSNKKHSTGLSNGRPLILEGENILIGMELNTVISEKNVYEIHFISLLNEAFIKWIYQYINENSNVNISSSYADVTLYQKMDPVIYFCDMVRYYGSKRWETDMEENFCYVDTEV